MRGASLRLRLAVAGAAAILAALTLAAFGLAELFERHVTRRAVAELSVHLDQLAAGVGRDADGAVAIVQPPGDPRFARPLSGLYWQVETADGTVIRSRSLWDAEILLPADALRNGAPHEHVVRGPGGADLVVLERLVTPPARTGVARSGRRSRSTGWRSRRPNARSRATSPPISACWRRR